MLCCKRTLFCRLCSSSPISTFSHLTKIKLQPPWNLGHRWTSKKELKNIVHSACAVNRSQTYDQLRFKSSFYIPQKKQSSNISKHDQSRNFFPWRIFASSDNNSIKEEFIAGETFQDVLNIVEKRRSLMNSTLIAEAFLQLSKIVENGAEHQPSDFVKNRGFEDLCILAENLVSETGNDELVTILHSLFLLCRDECTSLSNVVQSECHNRLNLFNHDELSHVAMWFYRRKQIKNQTLGHIAAIFQKELQKIDDFDSFARLTVSVMPICSQDFSQDVLDKVLSMLEDADPTGVPAKSIRLLLQALVVSRNCHTKILKHCVNILLPQLLSLSLTDLGSVHFCITFLGFSHKEINSSIRARFMQALPEVKDIKDIICTMEVLGGPSLSPFVRHQIEEKLRVRTEDITAESIKGVCNGLRLMRHTLDSSLMRKVINRIIDLTPELTVFDLISVCECLNKADLSPKEKIFDVLGKRLLEILDNAISSSRVKNVAYCLSQLPSESLDIMVVERLENMWSSYHAGDIHQIKKVLKIFCKRTSLNGYVKSRLNLLNAKVSYSVENIYDFRSIVYLNQYIDTLISSGVDIDHLVTAMGHYSNCLVGLSPKMAVQSVSRVSKTGYLQRDVLDKAAEVISENLDCIALNHIISMLIPYCVFNYVPASVPTFIESCAGSFLPFLDLVSTDHLLHLAYLLSLSGCFPEPLIRKIFSVEFLLKFDKHQLIVESSKKKELNLHRLFRVNRSVVLQCPQYQIPWFHQKFTKEYIHSATNEKQHHSIREMKDFLTELCGGPSYLRTNVLTPYHYNIHFECLLDADGRVLPSADYGSVLNQCKSVAIGTSHSTKWGVSVKQLPPGAQRVAIDYLFPSQFCLHSHHIKATSIAKRHNLELLGYKVIQVPYYEWNSKELFEVEDRLSYLQQLLLSDCKPMVKDRVEAEMQRYEEEEGLGGPYTSPSEKTAGDIHVLKVLGNMDKWS